MSEERYLEERMQFPRRLFGVVVCATALVAFSSTASATVTGTGCIVTGSTGQTAPTLATFNSTCVSTNSTFFSFGPAPFVGGVDVLNMAQPAGGNNTPGGFLASNSPTPIASSGSGATMIGSTGSSTSPCAPPTSCVSTWYDFTYKIGTAGTYTFSITHDDGIRFYQNATDLTAGTAAGPTTATPTSITMTVAVGDVINLIYDECCELPARLTANLPGEASSVPEPASIVLLGTLVLGSTAIRRRMKKA
jgi:hypothetical protein